MILKLAIWAIIIRQFEDSRKMEIFEKNQNLPWEYIPKKGSKVIVTSFRQT